MSVLEAQDLNAGEAISSSRTLRSHAVRLAAIYATLDCDDHYGATFDAGTFADGWG